MGAGLRNGDLLVNSACLLQRILGLKNNGSTCINAIAMHYLPQYVLTVTLMSFQGLLAQRWRGRLPEAPIRAVRRPGLHAPDTLLKISFLPPSGLGAR